MHRDITIDSLAESSDLSRPIGSLAAGKDFDDCNPSFPLFLVKLHDSDGAAKGRRQDETTRVWREEK